jgi:rhomboid protease GluP
MNKPVRNSILCPNCRKLISEDEARCPFCGIQTPGARWRNNALTRGWGSGETLIKAILYTNVGLYVFSLLLDPARIGLGLNPLGLLSPSNDILRLLGAAGTWQMSHKGAWWTLLTANYLHGSALHIILNLMALHQISPLIVQLYGPNRFFAIYTLTGVAGFWISYLVGIPLTIGASASLCGLIGAAIYYGKSRGGLFGQVIYKQIGGWALSILIFGFVVPGINNWAHIGGMSAGLLFGLLLGYQERLRENFSHRLLAGGCALATILTLLWGVLRGLNYWFH